MDDVTVNREGFEQALYSLLPTGLAGVDAARGRARLRTLVTLRWLAVAVRRRPSSWYSSFSASTCRSACA